MICSPEYLFPALQVKCEYKGASKVCFLRIAVAGETRGMEEINFNISQSIKPLCKQ